jgi:iron(III) transport system substrate-binding protein
MKKLGIFAITLLLNFIFFSQTNMAMAAKKQVYVYTSIYKEFITPIQKAFEAKNPDVDLQVFQAGSEKIQAKVEAELLSRKPQVDIILTSDPFWAYDLQKRGLSNHQGNPADLKLNYYSLMVMISHKNLAENQRPKSFSDLTKPAFKDLVQFGSPLESGTMFSSVAYLSKKYGWSYFKDLRSNGLASSGGNSTVIEKVESGEKKVGIVLLENALAAQKRGSPIEIIYPSDGSIPIPSVQVILKTTKEPGAAENFSKFIASKEGQELLRNGFMYSVNSADAAPAGARPLKLVTKNSEAWTPSRIAEVAGDAKKIKKQFNQIVLE